MTPRTVLPSESDKEDFVRAMFDTISNRYDLVNRLITLGLDQRWRKFCVESLHLSVGESVLDVACGTGDFLLLLQKAKVTAVGIDFSIGMLQEGRCSLPRVQGSALALPFDDASFEAITCGFALRNFKDIHGAFSEMRRVLKPGGRVAILEVSRPENDIIRLAHGIYFNHIVPRLGSLFSDNTAYRYLPQSVGYLPPAGKLCQMLYDHGFSAPKRHTFAMGATHLLYAEVR